MRPCDSADLEKRRTWFTFFFIPLIPLSGREEVRRCNLCGHENIGGMSSALPLVAPIEQKRCPQCAEFIQLEARVCRVCGYHLTPEDMEIGHQQAAATRQACEAALLDEAAQTRRTEVRARIRRLTILGWLIVVPAGIWSFACLTTLFMPTTPRLASPFALHLLAWFFIWLLFSTPLLLGIYLLRKGRTLRRKLRTIRMRRAPIKQRRRR